MPPIAEFETIHDRAEGDREVNVVALTRNGPGWGAGLRWRKSRFEDGDGE